MIYYRKSVKTVLIGRLNINWTAYLYYILVVQQVDLMLNQHRSIICAIWLIPFTFPDSKL